MGLGSSQNKSIQLDLISPTEMRGSSPDYPVPKVYRLANQQQYPCRQNLQ